jgi:ATP-dependent HslUV protease ATP-binding subunit HslU
MTGPPGLGTSVISWRLARLAQAPFIKVEASKFTEVGYVGRDVESIVRDLADHAVQMTTEEEKRMVMARADELAEERVLDCLLPPAPASGFAPPPADSAGEGGEREAPLRGDHRETREKLRRMLRQGQLDDRVIDVELNEEGAGHTFSVFTPQGVEEMGVQFKDLLGGLMPKRTRRRGV